jgi:hypothetical protein
LMSLPTLGMIAMFLKLENTGWYHAGGILGSCGCYGMCTTRMIYWFQNVSQSRWLKGYHDWLDLGPLFFSWNSGSSKCSSAWQIIWSAKHYLHEWQWSDLLL